MAEQRQYDVVMFGATGFTGALTAEYLARASAARPLRWAIAGRNRDKLERVRAQLLARADGAAAPETLIADVGDAASIADLARRARVVATTVGPYIQYGEPLVRACAEAGTDYVDLTGEPEFVDAITARYHAQAVQNRARIVNACGFDSVPHDLGAYFTIKALQALVLPAELERTPIKIEGFVRATGTISGGTWHSAITAMSRMRAYQKERKRRDGRDGQGVIDGRQVHRLPPRLAFRKEIGAWAVPMPTIDPEVVCHSARLLPAYGCDFRYGHYAAVRHFPTLAVGLTGLGALFALAQLPPTRALLLKARKPGDGPSEAVRARSKFRVTFLGEAAGHHVRTAVSGGDPGYGETAKMLAESALCLALDRDRLPACYGIVPTAAAMGDALIDRLQNAGIAFETLPA
jgi:short subunit dehydrogenase-like uncharacterized protein